MSATNEKPKYGYKATPQLSANQMAEYVSASTSPTRRRGIIREARFPKTSTVAQYNKAREGLVNFLVDGTRSFQHLATATDYLSKREKRPDATAWIKRDSCLSIEAIDAFQRAYNSLGLRKFDCRRVLGRLPPLDLWPTRVSVAMDYTVHKPVAGDKDFIGGAIFLFSRGESSSKTRTERCKTIAGLIYTHCTRFMTGLGKPDPSLCLAIDVFSGQSHAPQGTFARKLRNVADACDEIAASWRGIKPPADYDGPDPD
jgi:hypothetical protein